MVSLLLYSVGHTDQPSTEWRGTVQGREHQGAGITGGPVGITHIVTYKLRESKQVSIWKNDWEYSWIQNAFSFTLLSVLLSFKVTGWYRVPGTNCLYLEYMTNALCSEAESGPNCQLIACVYDTHMGSMHEKAVSTLLAYLMVYSLLFFPFLILFNRKGSGRNWKGHWCWQSPFPHWQGPDALHRSHHHGGAEADCGGATCHSSYDLRENRQVQCLSPLNALEGIPAFQSKEV